MADELILKLEKIFPKKDYPLELLSLILLQKNKSFMAGKKQAKKELLENIINRLKTIEEKKHLLIHIHSFRINCEDSLKEMSDK